MAQSSLGGEGQEPQSKYLPYMSVPEEERLCMCGSSRP